MIIFEIKEQYVRPIEQTLLFLEGIKDLFLVSLNNFSDVINLLNF